MKSLSREAIIRMTSGARGTVQCSVGGSESSGLSSAWVDENYLGKAFFSTLFIVHATQTVTVTDSQGEPVGEPVVTQITLAPNQLPGTSSVTDDTTGNTTTTVIAVSSIEATSSFWSRMAISALGQGEGGGGGATALSQLVDVELTNPANGDVLVYNSTLSKWVNGAGGGSGSVTRITTGTGLTGGPITSTGEISINSTYQTYISHGQTAYGWGNHANAGYLTSSDISDMATKTWVGQQGFLTSSDISDMATKTWVGNQNYLTGITSSMVTNALGFTPMSNAVTFWGSGVSGGVVNGSITMNNGTSNGIWMNDVGGTARKVLSMDGGSPSALYIGLDMLGYGRTFLRGNAISFTVGSGTDAAEFNSSGQLYLKQGTQGLRIGDAVLTWDSTNNALKIQKYGGGAVNVYATGGISTLGYSS